MYTIEKNEGHKGHTAIKKDIIKPHQTLKIKTDRCVHANTCFGFRFHSSLISLRTGHQQSGYYIHYLH